MNNHKTDLSKLSNNGLNNRNSGSCTNTIVPIAIVVRMDIALAK